MQDPRTKGVKTICMWERIDRGCGVWKGKDQ
jgi:hypothetical protein